jgi:hypothetical protein
VWDRQVRYDKVKRADLSKLSFFHYHIRSFRIFRLTEQTWQSAGRLQCNKKRTAPAIDKKNAGLSQ